MGWKDDIRSGSFRGAPFVIRSADSEFGRRNVNHEYPLRDTPYSQDFGRKQKKFTIEVFVIGDDYIAKRNRLIDACEKDGIGDLVHPYYGSQKVICESCKVREADTEEGRIATFSLSFAEAGERKFPKAAADALSRLGSAKTGIFSSVSSYFEKGFSVAKMPTKYVTKAVTQVQKLGSKLGGVKGLANTVSDYYTSANQLVSEASGLVLTPAGLVSGITGTFGAIAGLRFDFGALTSAYTGLLGASSSSLTPTEAEADDPASFSLRQVDIKGQKAIALSCLNFGDTDDDLSSEEFAETPVVSVTPTATMERVKTNTFVLKATVQMCALAVAAEAAGQIEYATIQDALKDREMFRLKIDELSENVEDDDVYQALLDLRTVIVESIPDPEKDLPNLISITNNYAVPSIVLAYNLYESLENESDLIARNNVSNPAFVPGGVELKVIKNG